MASFPHLQTMRQSPFLSSPSMRKFIAPVLCLLVFYSAHAQKKTARYPSLFWEITGKGLQKPSYLFGTMHVSDKMVFHLSDSFYNALQRVDEVALELNPYYWQRDMVKMDAGQQAIGKYAKSGANDYLDKQSFRLENYEDNLKAALNEEPAQINGLLYRNFQAQADFEENTYLDLYIYQTGRKLGKLAGGVEDYYESQRLMLEAYQDMAKDRMKKRPDTDGEPAYEIEKKIQDAYRRGDLDLLDSLEKFTSMSGAFTEKFLYRRNEIQGNSIDTILQHRSLFVGVGAAHLPGPRGVIEYLRKKGYTLRPIFMQDRDADRKETIDKLKVPVTFNAVSTDDGFVQLKVPGYLYKRADSRRSTNESWQYADMDNGTYYMLTRVKTHASFIAQTKEDVQRKTDSLLYENIPGKILKKTVIQRNGYTGFDITNRTRRGDLQRYNIFITPFEVLVFKISGNDNYVDGKEADAFFESIAFQQPIQQPIVFNAAFAGFTAHLPQQPVSFLNHNTKDQINRWEFESTDSANGNTYLVWKKTVQNYRFLEEDTFSLSLIEESFKGADIIHKELNRHFTKHQGYDALLMNFSLKSGGTIYAKAIIRGPHYYLLAVRSAQKNFDPSVFFNTFNLTDFRYNTASAFTDTALHFTVTTPVKPVLDPMLVTIFNKVTGEDFLNATQDYHPYWPKEKNAYFESDSTGEALLVNSRQYPKYFYRKDSAKFWKDELEEKEFAGMVIAEKTTIKLFDSCEGYRLVVKDTNTVNKLTIYYLLKDDRLFRITALQDTLQKESGFISSFLNSFRPDKNKLGPPVFQKKLDQFFADFQSKDSLTKKRVNEVINKIYFSCSGFDRIKQTIDGLKFGDKDYLELKRKFINRLGYMDDSDCIHKVEQYLSELYNKTADTSYFQNEVVQALANLKTKNSFSTLKNILLQDPPVFDNEGDYSSLLKPLEDTLALAKSVFPDLLQLASLNDYKEPVNSLLGTLVDSGYLAASDYAQYYSRIYFDAKTALKKQLSKEEKQLEKDEDRDNNSNGVMDIRYNRYGRSVNTADVTDYAVLLMPFYNQYPVVVRFFEKLLQSKDVSVQLKTALLMIRNKKPVPDSIWQNIAADDAHRARLLEKLEKIKRTDLFPVKYKKQELLAKALLLNSKYQDKWSDIQLLQKQLVTLKANKGYVYFFKYKLKKDDDWKIGISGLQPEKTDEVSTNDDLTKMTDKKLKADVSLNDQLQQQLQKLLFAEHKSATRFYGENDYDYLRRAFEDSGN